MDLVFSRTRKIPSKSWGQECSLCSSRHGVPIECSARGCKAAYHTTCAIRGKLKMQAIFGKDYKGGIKLRSYCKDHSPKVSVKNGIISQADKIDASGVKEIDMTNLVDDRLQDSNEELDYFWKYVDMNEVHKNISQAYARAKRLEVAEEDDSQSDNHEHAPIKKKNKRLCLKTQCSPKKSTSSKKSRSKEDESKPTIKINSDEVDPLMIDLIYRYWMLLRTTNNGQSLIKFSPSALKEREFEQRKSILKLRIELERVRNLSYMIGKREKLKAGWLKTHQNIIKRTFSIINDLHPVIDTQPSNEPSSSDCASINQLSTYQQAAVAPSNGKKANPYLQPTNGMLNESDQLLNDLITCDQIYDLPGTAVNSNYNNLSYQERGTLERRRTLSLVRRINRQLKSVNMEPSLNPYARSYVVARRSDSPVCNQHSPNNKLLKTR